MYLAGSKYGSTSQNISSNHSYEHLLQINIKRLVMLYNYLYAFFIYVYYALNKFKFVARLSITSVQCVDNNR